jgi:L-asparaginase
LWLFLLLQWAAAAPLAPESGLQPAPSTRPLVRVIATGGTISNHPGGRLTPDQLLAQVPDVESIARTESETFANVSSLGLSIADWARLSRRIAATSGASEAPAGVVVTSGTDTLEELAWFLHLTLPRDRPVVVTGAMRRPGAPDADGTRNLSDALRVACDPAARGRGTLVVMGGEIHTARDVMKVRTDSVETFRSERSGPVGRVDGGQVRFTRDAPAAGSSGAGFSPPDAPLPRVDVILTYQDAPGDLITAAIERGARGLVLAGAGSGSLTNDQTGALRTALSRGVVVVLASRAPAGFVDPEEFGQAPAGYLPAGDLAPAKARLLLMLALGRTSDAVSLRRAFAEH